MREQQQQFTAPIKSGPVHEQAEWGPEEMHLLTICCTNPSGSKKVQ